MGRLGWSAHECLGYSFSIVHVRCRRLLQPHVYVYAIHVLMVYLFIVSSDLPVFYLLINLLANGAMQTDADAHLFVCCDSVAVDMIAYSNHRYLLLSPNFHISLTNVVGVYGNGQGCFDRLHQVQIGAKRRQWPTARGGASWSNGERQGCRTGAVLCEWGDQFYQIAYDNVMTWICFPHCWPFVRGIHRWLVD